MSYTSYKYSNLKVSQSDFRHGDIIKVSVDVKNTGKVAGKESVLLFCSGLIADIEPLAQGIIDILIPGNMGGDALVNLVSGKSNFSKKMKKTGD